MLTAYTQRLTLPGRYAAALALLFTLSILPVTSPRAQDYPDRAVKIIVPFAAGGTADAVPRLVAG